MVPQLIIIQVLMTWHGITIWYLFFLCECMNEAHEHIYWDQASLLSQIGLIDNKELPIIGIK